MPNNIEQRKLEQLLAVQELVVKETGKIDWVEARDELVDQIVQRAQPHFQSEYVDLHEEIDRLPLAVLRALAHNSEQRKLEQNLQRAQDIQTKTERAVARVCENADDDHLEIVVRIESGKHQQLLELLGAITVNGGEIIFFT
jgi:tRNA1(Val) A37 N6-methylase TrmN6